jgi:hypothetical protein
MKYFRSHWQTTRAEGYWISTNWTPGVGLRVYQLHSLSAVFVRDSWRNLHNRQFTRLRSYSDKTGTYPSQISKEIYVYDKKKEIWYNVI